jgi:5-methylcytosine-specific restriction endonuclease McrA
MPIRPDLRHFYRGKAWQETRARILKRDGNCCAQCGKPNREAVETVTFKNSKGLPFMLWRAVSSAWWAWYNGKRFLAKDADQFFEGVAWRRKVRVIRVKIGVAHLDHDPANNADSNLRALCDWCHLHYDQIHHSETRARRKDAKRPLLEGAA